MVRATMIVEMAGRPPEHLKEAIEKHIGVLNQIKDIEVHSIVVSEPREIQREDEKKIPESQKMFTTFAEADFETNDMQRLTQIMFDFMPSSVEVTEPSKIQLMSNEATELMNNITGRLHRYDDFARVAGQKMKQMSLQLQQAQIILKKKNEEIEALKKSSSGTKKSTKKPTTRKEAKKKVAKKETKKKSVKKSSSKKK